MRILSPLLAAVCAGSALAAPAPCQTTDARTAALGQALHPFQRMYRSLTMEPGDTLLYVSMISIESRVPLRDVVPFFDPGREQAGVRCRTGNCIRRGSGTAAQMVSQLAWPMVRETVDPVTLQFTREGGYDVAGADRVIQELRALIPGSPAPVAGPAPSSGGTGSTAVTPRPGAPPPPSSAVPAPLGLPEARWTAIPSGNAARAAVDVQGVTPDGAYRMAWVRLIPPAPQPLGGSGGTFDTLYGRVRVDCTGRRVQTALRVFARGGQQVGTQQVAPTWESATPGSPMAPVADAVCSVSSRGR